VNHALLDGEYMTGIVVQSVALDEAIEISEATTIEQHDRLAVRGNIRDFTRKHRQGP